MWIRALGAGLIGGVVSTATILALGGAGMLRPSEGPTVDQRLDVLEHTASELDNRLNRDPREVADLDTIDRRLASLEKRLDQLESGDAAAAIPELAPYLSPLWSKLTTLEDRLDSTEDTANTVAPVIMPLETRVTSLEARLAKRSDSLAARMALLETRSRLGHGGDGRIAAAALLLGDLRDALDGGDAFGTQLDRLANLVDNDDKLAHFVDHIRPLAAGVATFDDLTARLDNLDIEVGHDGHRPAWVARTLTNLESLIVIRKDGDSGHTPLDLARAAMHSDDLALAITMLSPLEDTGGPALRQWLADARARLAVSETMAALERTIRELLAPPSRS
ncbi:MAG: hypothetical protein KDG54_06025 [Geminicoccaceae bacterium]|nr:hypothetical protein [Geminicoccaceae bacterium]